MSERSPTPVLAVGAGLVTGMRSMTLPAFLGRTLASEKCGGGAITPFLTKPPARNLLSMLAASEMIADKTPLIPDRTEPVSLIGRAVLAGICGAAIAEQQGSSRVGSALISSLTAVGSTFLSYKLRKKVGALTRVPDPLLGLMEDAMVLTAAYRLTDEV